MVMVISLILLKRWNVFKWRKKWQDKKVDNFWGLPHKVALMSQQSMGLHVCKLVYITPLISSGKGRYLWSGHVNANGENFQRTPKLKIYSHVSGNNVNKHHYLFIDLHVWINFHVFLFEVYIINARFSSEQWRLVQLPNPIIVSTYLWWWIDVKIWS